MCSDFICDENCVGVAMELDRILELDLCCCYVSALSITVTVSLKQKA